MINSAPKNRVFGFTLLELLVSMALMMLIGMLAYTSLSFGRLSLERTQETVSSVESVVNAQNRIREWLERAYPFDIGRSDRVIYYPLSGNDRSITFSTSLDQDAEFDRLSRVRLQLDEFGRQFIIQHQLDSNDTDQPAFDAPQLTLISGVSAVRIAYLEEGTPARWVSSWNRRQDLPLAIRFQVDLIDGDSRVFPDLIVRPTIDAPAWCDFDPVSRGCRNRRVGT